MGVRRKKVSFHPARKQRNEAGIPRASENKEEKGRKEGEAES